MIDYLSVLWPGTQEGKENYTLVAVVIDETIIETWAFSNYFLDLFKNNNFVNDGTEIVFKKEDLTDIKTSKEVLAIKQLEQYLDRIVDFEVMMNSELIKSRVTRFVGALLATHFER